MVYELRKDAAKEANFIRQKLDSITLNLMTTLIALGGLPGTGKTVIARELAREVNAVYVRIDSIEQAIRASGVLHKTIDDAGYRVAYVIAEDNLRMGRTVVADCVNPIQITRDAWIGVANRAQAKTVEVEIVCSDPQQHRQRVENRVSDIPGLKLPSWDEVISREYEPWQRKHIVIDTARRTVSDDVNELLQLLR
jgi:predicted kinase